MNPRINSALGLLALIVAAPITPGEAQEPLTVSPAGSEMHGSTDGFAAKARWLAGIGADERVETDFEGQLDGFDAAALYIDQGGASCESGTEVLILARPGAAPRIGRVEDFGCFSRPVVAKERSLQFRGPEEALVVRTSVSPSMNGQLWRFSAADGLKLVGTLAFAPQPKTTMSPKTTGSVRYAFEFYQNAEFTKRFRNLVGPDATLVMRATQTAEPVHRSEDDRFIVAPGCMPHKCSEEAGLLIVDTRTSSIFVAYKPGNYPIRVFPSMNDWPRPARQALKKWASPWS